MPLPHEVVAEAVVIAFELADQAIHRGAFNRAAYFGQVAVEAQERAFRLTELEARFPHLCSPT